MGQIEYTNSTVDQPSANRTVLSVPSITAQVVAPIALAVALNSLSPTVQAFSVDAVETAKQYAPASNPSTAVSSEREDLDVIALIRAFNAYQDGWKGQGSVRASQEAINDAEKFARALFKIPQVVAPLVGLSADGEINFYWKLEALVIDLGIEGDGTYSYFAEEAGGQKYYGDDLPIETMLPEEIITCITRQS